MIEVVGTTALAAVIVDYITEQDLKVTFADPVEIRGIPAWVASTGDGDVLVAGVGLGSILGNSTGGNEIFLFFGAGNVAPGPLVVGPDPAIVTISGGDIAAATLTY